ncbi:hypothetical protein GLAREA_04951 [Glarea lozoyensis ATCC 20868]|uniref:Rhodopsin domain-containing protein n=1 Tax=Glarea lozoyensis (strain ATCC 20868 / MF5171) TaxID=1116229 RepID=S3CR60_GLAL2|nr:uncharacterized protein GLAREA_04951 [Glarea lozoyensis ATCC 20868]EPE28160.1 hypothetical protein GLAREA_04951 [Glarea lozoyensis ATCC 20868]
MSSTSYEGLMALSSCMLGLSTISVALRFWVRTKQKASYKADDWFMVPSLLLLIGAISCALWGMQKKVVGYPSPKDPKVLAATQPMTSKLYITFQIFLVLTLGCIKASALFFYYRIFCVSGRSQLFRSLILVSLTITLLWTIAYLLLTVLQCGTHFAALWAVRAVKIQYCHISYPYLLSFAISDFIMDFWIIVLPLPQIWRIKSTVHRRVGVSAIFLLVIVGFAACIARMVVYVQINAMGPKAKLDARLVNSKSIYLSILEVGLSCIAVNLPSLWFLVTKIKPEDILRSVRSIISLQSFRSTGSHDSKIPGTSKSDNYVQVEDKNASLQSSSNGHLARPDAIHIETKAVHDVESDAGEQPVDVHVKKSFYQSSEHVYGKEIL